MAPLARDRWTAEEAVTQLSTMDLTARAGPSSSFRGSACPLKRLIDPMSPYVLLSLARLSPIRHFRQDDPQGLIPRRQHGSDARLLRPPSWTTTHSVQLSVLNRL